MRKKRISLSTIILVIILLVGLSVMLYPTVSDWWNSRVQTQAIASYDIAVEQIDDNHYDEIMSQAHAYNEAIAQVEAPLSNPDVVSGYEDILNISGTGIMGYITIPTINVQLPIYHGTSDEILNVAAGHLEGSSLPVGGTTTHSVISAHRGLPSARLFSDLDRLVVGDTFTITILDEILTYEVEEINIVLPHETSRLAISEGKDYVTLMTCTPYGINSHRLLVRAHRIETVYPHNIKVVSDAVKVDPMLVVPGICIPLLAILITIWIVGGKRRRKRSAKDIFDDISSTKKGR
jgi:sortase A